MSKYVICIYWLKKKKSQFGADSTDQPWAKPVVREIPLYVECKKRCVLFFPVLHNTDNQYIKEGQRDADVVKTQ